MTATRQSFYALDNTVQGYDWGSSRVIQELLGREVDGAPAAELWLGAHPLAPSVAATSDGPRALPELVRADPVGMLGRRVQDAYGPRLPYLLKVLAAERALSLQVHPKPHLARAGFNRENAAGVPVGAPERSFHDDQHKPELIVALTPFAGLAGFRRPAQAAALLDGLPGALVGRLREALGRRPAEAGVRGAFELAVHARRDGRVADDLEVTFAAVRERASGAGPDDGRGAPGPPARARARRRADEAALQLAGDYPGDPGAVASYLLNVFDLTPGEAVFLRPGQVHAYLRGSGVEIMASSDNVLRAGLTHKHVDVDALVECSDFVPASPLRPTTTAQDGGLTVYRVPIREFGLVLGAVGCRDAGPAAGATLPHAGPRIVLCLEGDVTLAAAGETHAMRSGESVFVPDAAGELTATGPGRVAVAFVP
jgi:mannose-6-phosphate isomerase